MHKPAIPFQNLASLAQHAPGPEQAGNGLCVRDAAIEYSGFGIIQTHLEYLEEFAVVEDLLTQRQVPREKDFDVFVRIADAVMQRAHMLPLARTVASLFAQFALRAMQGVLIAF